MASVWTPLSIKGLAVCKPWGSCCKTARQTALEPGCRRAGQRPRPRPAAPASSRAWSPQHKAHFSSLECRNLVSWLGPQLGFLPDHRTTLSASDGSAWGDSLCSRKQKVQACVCHGAASACSHGLHAGHMHPRTRGEGGGDPGLQAHARGNGQGQGATCAYRPGPAQRLHPCHMMTTRLAGPLEALAVGSACCWG